jgi:recombination protein RecA
VKAKVVKNKVAPPFRQAEFDIMFGEGISYIGELIDYGIKMDIVDKSGAWFSYGAEKLGQGKENAKLTLKENPELRAEIEAKVKDALGFGAALTVDESEMHDDS